MCQEIMYSVRDKGKLYAAMTVTAGEPFTPTAFQLYGGLALEREALYGDYLSLQSERLRRRGAGLIQGGREAEAQALFTLARMLEEQKRKWEDGKSS